MKKIYAVIFVFSSFFIFAQTHRFIYELKYKRDSLVKTYSDVKMILDITGNQVQFYESYAIRTDSLNSVGNGFKLYSFPFAKLKRKLASSENNNYYFLEDNYFSFTTNDTMSWEIQQKTKKKENWLLQKATTRYGGRDWEAWFTTDLPFPEGPYKFNGLPGLIVELKDTKDNFIFSLINVAKPKSPNLNIVETVFNKKPLVVSFEKYKEMKIANYNDPYARFRSMKKGSWSISLGQGHEVNTIDGLNKITKETQAEIRTKYNPIELDKAIHYK